MAQCLNFTSYLLYGSLKVPAWDRNRKRVFPKELRRYRGIALRNRRDIAVIERVRTLVCLLARTDGGWVHRPRRQLIMPRVRRESRKSVKPPRMVNCGMRMVNCRPRVTKHARRRITFFTEVRAPVRVARERNESEVVYADYIVPPRLTCRLCSGRRIPVPRVHTLCTFVTVSFLAGRSRASACIIVLEGERMHVRLPLSCLSFFLLGRISMPTRDVGVQTRNGVGGGGRCREGERECLKSRLMIRDDMRHSSLSDVWLDCRYCSLSFIFRELTTDARVHASECA